MINKEQSISLDYVKALGIISVVIGHYNLTPFGIPNPYLFHMPLFFFLGGIFLNPGKSISRIALSIVKKHISYIIVTYLIIGVITSTIINNTPAVLSSPFQGDIIDTLKSIYTSDFHVNSFFLVAWFLLAYSLASIISSVILKSLSHLKFQKTAIIAIAILLGYTGMDTLPALFKEERSLYYNYMSQALSGSMFMLLGFIAKDFIFKIQRVSVLFCCLFAVSLLTNSSIAYPVTMSWSSYPSGFIISTVVSLACIYIVFSAAIMIQSTFGETLLLHVGKSSKTIMSYHLLVMYLIDMEFWKLGDLNIKDASAMVHYYSPLTWPLYILIPVISLTFCSVMLRKTKAFRMNRKVII